VRIAFVQSWHDNRLQWDPDEYGGVRRLYVKPEDIWLPDIVLYNRCDNRNHQQSIVYN